MKMFTCKLNRKVHDGHYLTLPKGTDRIRAASRYCPSCRPVLGVAMNQSAVASLRLFGGCLLNLNGGDLIRTRRPNRDNCKGPVHVARSNGHCGLLPGRPGNHPAVDQYGYAEPRAGIARIGLFDL